jgi:hypothetical protein
MILDQVFYGVRQAQSRYKPSFFSSLPFVVCIQSSLTVPLPEHIPHYNRYTWASRKGRQFALCKGTPFFPLYAYIFVIILFSPRFLSNSSQFGLLTLLTAGMLDHSGAIHVFALSGGFRGQGNNGYHSSKFVLYCLRPHNRGFGIFLPHPQLSSLYMWVLPLPGAATIGLAGASAKYGDRFYATYMSCAKITYSHTSCAGYLIFYVEIDVQKSCLHKILIIFK